MDTDDPDRRAADLSGPSSPRDSIMSQSDNHQFLNSCTFERNAKQVVTDRA